MDDTSLKRISNEDWNSARIFIIRELKARGIEATRSVDFIGLHANQISTLIKDYNENSFDSSRA